MLWNADNRDFRQVLRRDFVAELLRRVAGSYTVGRLLIPVIAADSPHLRFSDASICEDLVRYARDSADDVWRKPKVLQGYDIRDSLQISLEGRPGQSPFEYAAIGTCEQMVKYGKEVLADLLRAAGVYKNDFGSGNRDLIVEFWNQLFGQPAYDDVAIAWLAPARPSKWQYLVYCGADSPHTKPNRVAASGGSFNLSFGCGDLAPIRVPSARWRRLAPKSHPASDGRFERISLVRQATHADAYATSTWDEKMVTPIGEAYQRWIDDATRMGSIPSMAGRHGMRCYVDNNLILLRLRPSASCQDADMYQLTLALDWPSAILTGVQTNFGDFADFLRIVYGSRSILRLALGL